MPFFYEVDYGNNVINDLNTFRRPPTNVKKSFSSDDIDGLTDYDFGEADPTTATDNITIIRIFYVEPHVQYTTIPNTNKIQLQPNVYLNDLKPINHGGNHFMCSCVSLTSYTKRELHAIYTALRAKFMQKINQLQKKIGNTTKLIKQRYRTYRKTRF